MQTTRAIPMPPETSGLERGHAPVNDNCHLKENSNSAATAVGVIASQGTQQMPPNSFNPGANDQWVISTCKSVNPEGGASSAC